MTPMARNEEYRTRWTGDFWGDRIDACRSTMVPHMLDLLRDSEVSHCWANFLIASGREEGDHAGPPFHDGDFYKWLEAASALLGQFPDVEREKELDEIIGLIGEVQQPDGYIFTQYSIGKRKDPDKKPLDDELNFEVYNLGHLMTAGCVHFRATGKETLLNLGIRAASYLEKTFDERDKARTAICPSHYMGLADLYRATGDKRWLTLLEKLLDMRDYVPNGTDDNQDRIPLHEQREIIGHAVRATYLYAGVTDLLLERGRRDYLPVLEGVWNDLTGKKMYITGNCGALYDGVSPYGSEDYFSIQRTHQSFGRAYELPNLAGYNETCAAIGSYLWNGRMLQAFGDSRFADLMERTLYNGCLPGISLDGKKYFYTNSLRHREGYTLADSWKWSRHREPYISSFCCPPNLLRTMAETASWICASREKGLAFLFYGSAEIVRDDWGEGALFSMASRFPWDGEVVLTVKNPGKGEAYPLFFRIPEWAGEHRVELNGKPLDTASSDQGFLKWERVWQEGDVVKLNLTMPVRLFESHPLLEETRNHTALMRGPLVYCLEGNDLPEGAALGDVYLKADLPWKPVEGEIGGLPLIFLEGKGYLRTGRANEELYRPLGKPEYREIPVRLIPYFLWDNRSPADMSVWLPLKPE